MNRSRILVAALLLIMAPAAVAQEREDPRLPSAERRESRFLLRRDQPLREAERLELERRGVRVLRAAGGNDYIVRGRRAAAVDAGQALEITPADKLQPAAEREIAATRPVSRLRIMFHDDVSFEDAKRVVVRSGGMISDPLTTNLDLLNMLDAIVPDAGVERLLEADEVFRVTGPQRKIAPANANAALMSNVTPLYSAPYDLSGKDVVASLWDCGNAQADHPEFGGRMTLHDNVSVAQHPTHVGGTVGAAGTNPSAKGMAPAVTLHQYDVGCPSGRPFLVAKNEAFPLLNIRVDNNSWSFIIGWRQESAGEWTWYGAQEGFGLYIEESSGLDKIARTHGTLMMFSAGNDADDNGPSSPPFAHKHDEDDTNTWCASSDGSGNDCPAAPQCTICEKTKHPPDGPFTAIGPLASSKNVLAVGAVFTTKSITGFSSRGPALDGRVKPDVVAKGTNVFSSVPTSTYGTSQGTSMSSPVVTGVAALLVEQWRKTMGSPDPVGSMLRALIIDGTEDLGTPGPDYTYGFGLVNAKASVDLIRADNRNGTKIRSGSVQQGGRIEFPMTVGSTSDLRVTLVWDDLEAVPEPLVALVNDLDMRLIGPTGAATLPYVLNVNDEQGAATRGVNSVDTVEQIELKGSPAGTYKVEITGTRVGGAGQSFSLVGTGDLGTPVQTCTDIYEPNDSDAAAFGPLVRNQELNARTCGAADVDVYRSVVNETGPVTVLVRATDTPIRATLTGGPSPVTADLQAGQSTTLSSSLGAGSGQPTAPATFLLRIQPLAQPGTSGAYSVTPTFGVFSNRGRTAHR